MMMKELYDITELFKIFKRILKSGPDFDLRRKMMVNGGNLAVPEPAIIHYCLIWVGPRRSLFAEICSAVDLLSIRGIGNAEQRLLPTCQR